MEDRLNDNWRSKKWVTRPTRGRRTIVEGTQAPWLCMSKRDSLTAGRWIASRLTYLALFAFGFSSRCSVNTPKASGKSGGSLACFLWKCGRSVSIPEELGSFLASGVLYLKVSSCIFLIGTGLDWAMISWGSL